MVQIRRALVVAAFGSMLALGVVEVATAADCPDDSVRAGTACIDKYEASLWHVSPSQRNLIGRIQDGTVRLEQLIAGGAVQIGLTPTDWVTGCDPIGNGCRNVYAVSIAGVTPSTHFTWFQAVAAARNSLKRLPTNQEWQMAAFGTPDPNTGPSPCNVSGALAQTGSAPGCVSDVGAFDMVGNLAELVAEWGDNGYTCSNLKFGNDESCFGGPNPNGLDNPSLPRVSFAAVTGTMARKLGLWRSTSGALMG